MFEDIVEMFQTTLPKVKEEYLQEEVYHLESYQYLMQISQLVQILRAQKTSKCQDLTALLFSTITR